ncbi:MAG: hypothetical protein V9E90_02195 [Saprospiraceae bacterium]
MKNKQSTEMNNIPKKANKIDLMFTASNNKDNRIKKEKDESTLEPKSKLLSIEVELRKVKKKTLVEEKPLFTQNGYPCIYKNTFNLIQGQ